MKKYFPVAIVFLFVIATLSVVTAVHSFLARLWSLVPFFGDHLSVWLVYLALPASFFAWDFFSKNLEESKDVFQKRSHRNITGEVSTEKSD